MRKCLLKEERAQQNKTKTPKQQKQQQQKQKQIQPSKRFSNNFSDLTLFPTLPEHVSPLPLTLENSNPLPVHTNQILLLVIFLNEQ